jgi:hypothetical protein
MNTVITHETESVELDPNESSWQEVRELGLEPVPTGEDGSDDDELNS